LCPYDGCALPRRHRDGCANSENHDHSPHACSGCLPAQAADGLTLCTLHTDRIAEDAITCGRLHTDLELQLRRQGRGERTSGSGEMSLIPDPVVMDARHEIKQVLAGLVELMVSVRGFALPNPRRSRRVRETVSADARLRLADLGVGGQGDVGTGLQSASQVEVMAAFIAQHHLWFAAHKDAARHARALHDICHDKVMIHKVAVRIWSLAYPTRSKDFQEIGTCPLKVVFFTETGATEEETCGGRVVWYPEQSSLAYCGGCDQAETIEWWRREIMGDPDAVLDTVAAASWLSDRWRRPVQPSQIANWASRGRLARLTEKDGDQDKPVRDKRGRQLYRLDVLEACATKMFGPPAQATARGKLVAA
jgi:hypothetical protein